MRACKAVNQRETGRTGGAIHVVFAVPGSISNAKTWGFYKDILLGRLYKKRCLLAVFCLVPKDLLWTHKPRRIAEPLRNEPDATQWARLRKFLLEALRESVRLGCERFARAGIAVDENELLHFVEKIDRELDAQGAGTET